MALAVQLATGEGINEAVLTIKLASNCPTVPRSDCATSARGLLRLKGHDNPARRKLVWRWLEGDAEAGEFGDPTSPETETSYALCVYDDSTLVSSALAEHRIPCEGFKPNDPFVMRRCWKSIPTGFRYLNKSTDQIFGIAKGLLKEGNSPGKAKIVMIGRGESLDFPNLPLMQSSEVTVQIAQIPSSGVGASCWETVRATAPDFEDHGSARGSPGPARRRQPQPHEPMEKAPCESIDRPVHRRLPVVYNKPHRNARVRQCAAASYSASPAPKEPAGRRRYPLASR